MALQRAHYQSNLGRNGLFLLGSCPDSQSIRSPIARNLSGTELDRQNVPPRPQSKRRSPPKVRFAKLVGTAAKWSECFKGRHEVNLQLMKTDKGKQ